ncbi:MAG: AtpZ/AtpI family protein [Oscillospiraceae bacterium]|nr:AtpZ/AtpI family protein [Oscillospiraceae bacterium]
MKNLSLLVWLTQLGFSVAVPLGGFVLLAIWLQRRFDLGAWVIVLGVVLGVIGAIDGLRNSLKAMERMAGDKKEEKPTVSFNDHD